MSDVIKIIVLLFIILQIDSDIWSSDMSISDMSLNTI